MPFSQLDRAAVSRTLSQIAERPGDLADAFFERVEEIELPGGRGPGVRARREEGLAVRLVRGGRTWLASRDEISAAAFADAVRRAARAQPTAAYPEPKLPVAPWEGAPAAPELAGFPSAVARAVRDLRVAFPLALTVRRHRRWLQVVAGPLVPDPEREEFYSVAAELPWGRFGALLPRLDGGAAEAVAAALADRFRARAAPPPEPFRGVVVLGPAAAAVLLHEAVAHALEADVLAASGDPESAVGVRLGPESLSVLDDPGSAPEGVRRRTDDEGREVRRRWLLQAGEVRQPLADARWAQPSEVLLPGAGRRGGRHDAPGPRSTHLELLPGEHGEDDLLAGAEGGLSAAEADRGALDPLTGAFRLELPFARRIRAGGAADPVGRCRLAGRVVDLLGAVAGIGRAARPAGAGWCAKGGQKLPVWATCPALRLEGVEVAPWR
jgi:predicted Zn-dependent protease